MEAPFLSSENTVLYSLVSKAVHGFSYFHSFILFITFIKLHLFLLAVEVIFKEFLTNFYSE